MIRASNVLVVVLDLWPHQQTEDDDDHEYEHEYPGKPRPFWVRHEHCHE